MGAAVLEDLLLPDKLYLGLKGHDLYFEIVKPVLIAELGRIVDQT